MTTTTITVPAPTDRQIAFVTTLLTRLGVPETVDAVVAANPTRKAMSSVIDRLIVADNANRAAAPTTPTVTVPSPAADPMTKGIYRTPDGDVVKVQANRQTGNLYGKTWTPIGGHRLVETGDVVQFEFVYTGSIHHLTPAMRMTIDDAIAFGIEYGVCCNCGASLKDAESVKAGIGPVCAKKFA